MPTTPDPTFKAVPDRLNLPIKVYGVVVSEGTKLLQAMTFGDGPVIFDNYGDADDEAVGSDGEVVELILSRA